MSGIKIPQERKVEKRKFSSLAGCNLELLTAAQNLITYKLHNGLISSFPSSRDKRNGNLTPQKKEPEIILELN
jgi:hypothetical protein